MRISRCGCFGNGEQFGSGQQAVQARNAQLWLVPPVIVRVPVNMPLNMYLIPRCGYIGASVSMVITDNTYYTLMYVFAFREPEVISEASPRSSKPALPRG